MGSSGEKRDAEKQKVIGQKAKKAKISNPSGIHSSKLTSADRLVCSRSKCVEGTVSKGKVVTFSLKANGNPYKECDVCQNHTGEKNPKTNTKVTLSSISNPTSHQN